MKIVDEAMSRRIAEELLTSGYSDKELRKLLGCSKGTVSHWVCGDRLPHPTYLAKLYELNFDVIYMLTGKRVEED
jgi:transcriptional regulator with XRE-family HTH domain